MKVTHTRLALTLVACVALRADPVTLLPENTVPFDGPSSLAGGTLVTSSTSLFGGGTLLGQINASVWSGVTANPHGGLTFAYELQNLGSSESEGLIDFSVGSWGGYATSVGFSGLPGVMPGDTTRSSGAGSLITFTFPFDTTGSAPPIFSLETGRQLFVFTDATSWDIVRDASANSAFDQFGNGSNSYSFSTLGAGEASASVPDSGATGAFLVLSLGALFWFTPRRQLARK